MGWLTPAGLTRKHAKTCQGHRNREACGPAEATFLHKWEPVRVPQGWDLEKGSTHNRSTHSRLPPAVGEGPQTPNPLGPVPWHAHRVLKNHTEPTASHAPSHAQQHAATQSHT